MQTVADMKRGSGQKQGKICGRPLWTAPYLNCFQKNTYACIFFQDQQLDATFIIDTLISEELCFP